MHPRKRKARAKLARMMAVAACAGLWFTAEGKAASGDPTGASVKVNNQFFDYFVPAQPAPPSYIPSPSLTNANAAAVNTFLAGLPAGSVLAVKVEAPINSTTANLIFNNPNYQVGYVLGDLEGVNAASNAAALVNQVRFVNGTSTQTTSYNAYVGNFGFAPLPNDPTRPANYGSQFGQHSFSGFSGNQYNSAGLNMANVELYPGSPSFRNPIAGNSSAPNIRSALFTLPVLRASYVTKNLDSNHAHIPWITNFNNWGNTAFHTPNSPSNTQGFPFFWANPTQDQLLSRQDVATLVAHYRLRGADSFALMSSGNTAVTNSELRADAEIGWTQPAIDAILQASDGTTLLEGQVTYPQGGPFGSMSLIISDGQVLDVEAAGAILSGAYSEDLGKLAILISNLDGDEHVITVPEKIAGYALETKDFTLAGGTHWLVEYSLNVNGNKKGWAVAAQHVPFTAISNSRHGFGIPEPGTLSLLVVGAILGVNRRNRPERAARA